MAAVRKSLAQPRRLAALAIVSATCGSLAPLAAAQIAGPPAARPALRVAAVPERPLVLRSQIPPEELPLGRSPAAESVPPGRPVAGPPELTLGELEGLALANHPALGRAAALVQAARGRWLQVGLPPNPVAGYLGTEIGDSGRAGQQGGFVTQEFVRGGKLQLNRAVAAQEVRRAEAELAAMQYRVVTDTRLAFYDLLVAQQRVGIAQQLANISQQGLRGAEGLFRGQQVSQVDVLQARIESDSAAILVANARNDEVAAWRELSAVIGLPGLNPRTVAGDLNAIPHALNYDALLDRLMATSPEIGAALADVARARQAVARARAEPIPNWEVQGGVQHDNASGSDIALLQIGVPAPIWNRNPGGIQQAQSQLVAAQREVERLRNELQHRLASAYQRYLNAHQQALRYRDRILPDAKRSLELVSEGYRAGEFSYLLQLTAQRTFFQTSLANLEAMRQLRRSEAELEGLLLSGSLASPAIVE